MRILMLAQFYPPIIGGEERHVRNLSIGLVRRGHEVTVATLSHAGADAEGLESGVKICRLRGTMQRAGSLFQESDRRHAPPFPDPELVYQLRKLLLREKPDIIHAHNWIVHSYLPLKRWYGAPLAVTLHDFSLLCAKKNAMYRGKICTGPSIRKCIGCSKEHYGPLKGGVTAVAAWVSRLCAKGQTDAFIAVSTAVADGNLLAHLRVRHTIIPNFVPDDISEPSPEADELPGSLPKQGYILFVGDLNHIKGVPVLLEAYSRLPNAPPLVLIGRSCPDTPLPSRPGVIVHQRWPHTAIMEAWRHCLFGVAPSVWADPCPTVIMEAMACGKAVVSTRVGGSQDLIDHESTGLLTNPGDPESLANAMNALLTNPQLRERMADAALAKVETLKAKSVIPRIENVYESLLAARKMSASEEAFHAA